MKTGRSGQRPVRESGGEGSSQRSRSSQHNQLRSGVSVRQEELVATESATSLLNEGGCLPQNRAAGIIAHRCECLTVLRERYAIFLSLMKHLFTTYSSYLSCSCLVLFL